ncbi:MAG TPA: GYF domain-containing protein [Solirubrobacteraceae bacterium]
MKFLCDRCKTRYSIGDDRVRGKILKIRCKNCANVITVREGMADPGPVADSGPLRRKQPTTMSPSPSHTSPAAQATGARGNGALASAFASQMTKPPAALEEEWYVSIDGEQSGPFALAEAQRWIASKAFDADLHCWSEGFDDWLPVDKVSHFRGLRKKPAPAPAPPPLPRVAPRLAAVPVIEEATPKPLFAATMAALEKGASGSLRVPAGVPAVPAIAKTNGSGAAPIPVSAKGTASGPAVGRKVDSAPIATTPAPRTLARGVTKPGLGAAATPGAQALAAAFDVPAAEEGDSLTAVEAPAFTDELMPAHAASRAAPRPAEPDPSSDDDSLEIGEVSRVVNLADLARSAPPRKTSRAPQLRTTASTPKFHPSEVMPAAGLAAGVPNVTGPFLPLDLAQSEGVVAPAPAAASRRGLILMLVGAGLLLAGVLATIVWIATSSDDSTEQGGLGRQRDYDMSRPDEVVQHIHDQATGSGSAATKPQIHHWTGAQIMRPGSNGPDEVTDPTKRELDAVEVEDMAAKQGDGTNFCYKRAQRGALGLEIQDLRKMEVTLTVDKEGAVGDVHLSSHAADSFGICLANRIKGWKFRQSSGAKTFQITLVFQSS